MSRITVSHCFLGLGFGKTNVGPEGGSEKRGSRENEFVSYNIGSLRGRRRTGFKLQAGRAWFFIPGERRLLVPSLHIPFPSIPSQIKAKDIYFLDINPSIKDVWPYLYNRSAHFNGEKVLWRHGTANLREAFLDVGLLDNWSTQYMTISRPSLFYGEEG